MFAFVIIRIILRKQKNIKKKVEPKILFDNNTETESKLSQNELQHIYKKLIKYIEQEKPYLKSNLKIGDLANEIDVPVSDLSNVLNMHMNTNFTDFINTYRINEFINRLQEKESLRFTMTALAELCGFNSKATFYRVFKKKMGKSPVEYAKELGVNLSKE